MKGFYSVGPKIVSEFSGCRVLPLLYHDPGWLGICLLAWPLRGASPALVILRLGLSPFFEE